MEASVLKLLAEEAEGLAIVAAAVQDALVKPQDIKLDRRSRAFGLEINRFQWETAGVRPPFFRSRAVLAFSSVLGAKQQKMPKGVDDVLGLLDIRFTPGAEAPAGAITLVFTSGAHIQLDVECIDVTLMDTGTTWPTKRRPDHEKRGMNYRRFNADDPGFADAFAKFLNLRRAQGSEEVFSAAAAIVKDVRQRGGQAVAAYTSKFDKVTVDPDTLAAKGIDLVEAAERCKPDVRDALDFAAKRIEAYHAQQKPQDHSFTDKEGLELGWRWTPIDAVGLYVPGGRASYPSSVLMNAIPAKAAGVSRLAMVAPVPGGEFNPAVAYAAVRAGVTEFYPIGGAQAVAALAYGAGRLKPVDKIVGPGNAYVAAAKRIVFGDVGIDTIAGPSEITVVADNQNKPDWIAADLLSQAEHDPMAQSILITDDAAFADKVFDTARAMLEKLGPTALEAWRSYAAAVIAPLSEAARIVNHHRAGARRDRHRQPGRDRKRRQACRRHLPRPLGA